jgi:hypothetical protein
MKKLFALFKPNRWTDHLIQFFIVLLSITIAFNLEGYRQKVNERKEELENLHSLLEDLKQDINYFDLRVQVNEEKLNIIKHFQNNAINTISAKDDWFTQLRMITDKEKRFTPMDITYTSMMNSGKLGTIKNRNVRNFVIQIYHRVYSIIQEEQQLFNTRSVYVQTYRVETYKYDEKNDMIHFIQPKFMTFLRDEKVNIESIINYYRSCIKECTGLIKSIEQEIEN